MNNLKKGKLYFQVYEEIKRFIVKYNYKPGDKLPTEMQMMEKLGVSRNVVREAMKTLEIIGVVSSKPGVGVVLNAFNAECLSNLLFLNLIGDGMDLLKQSLEVRSVMELGFAEKSYMMITDEKIEELKDIVEEMKMFEEKTVDFYELDRKFHHALHSGLGNEILLAFIDSAWSCETYFKMEKTLIETEKTIIKHAKIVDALEKKDYIKYMEAFISHFNVEFKPSKYMELLEASK